MRYAASILFFGSVSPFICHASFIEYKFTQVFEGGGNLEGSFTVDTSLDDGDNIWEGGLEFMANLIWQALSFDHKKPESLRKQRFGLLRLPRWDLMLIGLNSAA